MIIKRITTNEFMSHQAPQTVRLPDVGIVLVTGHNGAGKSTLVEAVATAVYGKTLRGKPPWRADTAGYAEVETDTCLVRRSVTKSGTKALKWAETGKAPTQWETNTKAQSALEALVGSYDVWRRACVFSAQDVAHFTLASDGERKRLLESILDLGRFDTASEACRKDLGIAEKAAAKCANDCAVYAARFDGERKRKGDAETALAQLGGHEDVKELRALHDRCIQLIRDTQAEATKVRAGIYKLEGLVTAADQKVQLISNQRTLVQAGNCRACGRPWDAQHAGEVAADYDVAVLYELVLDLSLQSCTHRRRTCMKTSKTRMLSVV